MGLFDEANEAAYRTLIDVSVRAMSSRARFGQWESAQQMLRDHYSADRAVESSAQCARRIEYLKVAEPLPVIEDFFPSGSYPKHTANCQRTLDGLQRRFEHGCVVHRQRESVRLRDLAWATMLHDQLAMAERSRRPSRADDVENEQDDVEIAAVAETPEQLQSLMREKHSYWEWAAFTSVLVQRRHALRHLLNDHRDSVAPPSGRRVTNTYELYGLIAEVFGEVTRLAGNFGRYVNSPAFQRMFSERDLYDEPTPAVVTAIGTTVIEFYEANLLLARDTRAVTAEGKYALVIDDLAHLVDRSLEAIDDFITNLVGFLDMLPTLVRTGSADHAQRYPLKLDLDLDNRELLERINRRVDSLDKPWKRWFR